jgi:3-oxoacyl-(acyl-carrier-protein) synthase
MTLKILGAGTIKAIELEEMVTPAAWRKASRNMILATLSIERALRQVPELQVAKNHEVGLVLGSSSGELETSAEFLTTWSKLKMARPVLFQNSLHNATTGFASIHFQITGPSITMSARETTPQECVDMAANLLHENECQACIVTLVEAHKTLANWIGEDRICEGACTLILGLSSGVDLPEVSLLNYVLTSRNQPLVPIDNSGFWGLARELELRG